MSELQAKSDDKTKSKRKPLSQRGVREGELVRVWINDSVHLCGWFSHWQFVGDMRAAAVSVRGRYNFKVVAKQDLVSRFYDRRLPAIQPGNVVQEEYVLVDPSSIEVM